MLKLITMRSARHRIFPDNRTVFVQKFYVRLAINEGLLCSEVVDCRIPEDNHYFVIREVNRMIHESKHQATTFATTIPVSPFP